MRGQTWLWATALLLNGCEYLPERVRETPELTGLVTQAGTPVSGATVSLLTIPDDAPGAPDCGAADIFAQTNGDGAFSLDALTRVALRRDSMKTASAAGRGRFVLCIQPPATKDFSVAFRAPMGMWDTLDLACDLERAWLARDRHGVEGRCVTQRMAVDAQPLGARPGRSPARTCDTTTTLIEPLRLGAIRINGSIPELRRLCPQLRDTLVERDDLYGTTRQMASVMNVAGEPVIIFRGAGVIYQIVVQSPKFRTTDSLGVGTSVRRLLDKPELNVVVAGVHQGPYVLAWHGSECGLGYSLTRPTYDRRDRIGVPIPVERLRVWPAETSIRRVIIGFCPQREVIDMRPS
ncbi:MAG TPA: hypothetical protein VEB19_13805 [Gemmatimonadaceae bacterium]|nr:hypothetical protein [Gemmatimonadaceae bacterium]